MFGTKSLKSLMIAGALALMASGASAVTTVCPNSPSPSDREFTLTTNINNSCFFSGSPNDNNNTDFQNLLAGLVPSATLLGKIEYDDNGDLVETGPEVSLLSDMVALLNGTSGFFDLDLTGIVNAVLVFKVGNKPGPAFAAFLIEGGVVTDGFWSSTPSQGGGLSHVSLYGSLGSRLIDNQSQKMTVAARATAERKVVAHLS